MSNSIYFSAQMTANGEIKLIKHDGTVSSNPAPQVVTVFVDGKRAYVPNDPTLTVYHQPDKDKH